MNIAEIELKLKALSEQPYDPASFAYRILEIYDAPRATITKLQNGSMNKGERDGDVLWKGKLFFRPSARDKAAATLDAMKTSEAAGANRPRFLLATDGLEVSGLDTKSDETFHARFSDLNEQFDFLLPLSGVERYKAVDENPADIKAAGRLAKFYDAILEHNPDWKDPGHRHALNLFMTRTLFCMFAEDTGILEKDLFTKTVDEFTLEDGSDTHEVMKSIYDVMDRKTKDRDGFPAFAKDFPYVNGGLFREQTEIPVFSKKARRVLIEAAQLDWSVINPDIFGSMIQAVVDPTMRGDLGMHYTSVPNIMKLIGPLFLDKLQKEFEASRDNAKRLERLLSRIYRIRIFDPACGSGNFLIISYRELRRLEMRIFKRLQEISPQFALPMSQVRLSQFYGIEYADFAAETAKLSLWISEYQANKEFEKVFGSAPPALPLKDSGSILQANALRTNWYEVCPPSKGAETYVVGNPPYYGSANQTEEQKQDMTAVFSGLVHGFKNLDYVAAWFWKGSEYCRRVQGECAFVATNSLCQGEQVALLWPPIFDLGIEIGFAHRSFKWKNNASNVAGVTCVIVGLRQAGAVGGKTLFSDGVSKSVTNIGPYLLERDNLVVNKVSKPLFGLEAMDYGSKPTDGGHLILSSYERKQIVADDARAAKFIRRYYGTQEFIKGVERYCIWIGPQELDEALSVEPLRQRIALVSAFRSASIKSATANLSDAAYRFAEIRHTESDCLIVPIHFSEGRDYFTIGFTSGSRSVISNACYSVCDAPAYLMAVLSSRLHAVWVETVCGQLETRIRYSNTLGYNTFPIPRLSEGQKKALEDAAWKIIEEREANPGKTISELYDPKTMPKGLLKAHRDLDVTLETFYRGRPFKNDTERLEHLFKLYAAKTGKAAAADRGRAA